jgi:hypothetical protein
VSTTGDLAVVVTPAKKVSTLIGVCIDAGVRGLS